MFLQMEVVPMGEEDLKKVLKIERASFVSPWSKGMFESELFGNPFSFPHIVRLPESGRIIGYVCFWIVLDELHLLNFTIDSSFREQGFGEEVVRWVLQFAAKRRVRSATLEVRVSNLPALRLYKKLGFEVYTVRKEYYSKPLEDALLLRFNYNGGLNGKKHGDGHGAD